MVFVVAPDRYQRYGWRSRVLDDAGVDVLAIRDRCTRLLDIDVFVDDGAERLKDGLGGKREMSPSRTIRRWMTSPRSRATA